VRLVASSVVVAMEMVLQTAASPRLVGLPGQLLSAELGRSRRCRSMTPDHEPRMQLRPRLAVTSCIAIATAVPASPGGVPPMVSHRRALSSATLPKRRSTTNDA